MQSIRYLIGDNWQALAVVGYTTAKMTDEETLCTALSLLIYGDCLMLKSQEGEREWKRQGDEHMVDRWLLDDGPEEQHLFPASVKEKYEKQDLMQFDVPNSQIERQTLFMAPLTLPSPIQAPVEKPRSNSPVPSAIFISSDPSDDWVIA